MTTTASSPSSAPARAGWNLARTAGAGLGAVYLLVGVVGAVLTGWSHWTSMHGTTLLVFQVNPMHNVAHLGLGAALVIGAAVSAEAARSVDRLVGVVFALLGLVGPFVMGTSMDPIAVNSWDHLLHFGTAVVLLGAVWATRAPRTA